jgi:hypothetical protein
MALSFRLAAGEARFLSPLHDARLLFMLFLVLSAATIGVDQHALKPIGTTNRL